MAVFRQTGEKSALRCRHTWSTPARVPYLGTYADVLDRTRFNPDEQFVRTLLDMAGIDGRRTTRMIEEHTPIVRDAAQALLDRLILARVGFADRKDLVKVPAGATPAASGRRRKRRPWRQRRRRAAS